MAPNERHWMTKRDLLERNVDLIERAGSLLVKLPCYALTVHPPRRGATMLKVTTRKYHSA